MKLRNILAVALSLQLGFGAVAQKIEAPEGYYRNPVDIPMLPSANFAETRTNHFHSGVDIKTQGVEGKPLYSVADGYVSRIGVSPSGFGRALYIAHPNGSTSVYGHMQKFTPEVEAYVMSERYRRKIHNVDLYPSEDKFPVKKGDPIGHSGNSGSSGGPHLHFEIRETAAQRPVNVLARGYLKMKDDIPPRIVNLYYIETDTVGVVPVYSKPRLLGVKNVAQGKYTLNGVETIGVGPRGYFVLEVTDRKNDSDNTMGVYEVEVLLGGHSIYGFSLDGFTFDKTRYVNSMMQYDMQDESRNQMLRLAVQGNNKLQVFNEVINGGLVMLNDDAEHPVEIRVADDNGNASTLSFNVKRRADRAQFYTANDVSGIPVDCRHTFSQSLPGVDVTIPAGALYESIFYRQSEEDPAIPAGGNAHTITHYSPVYTLHDKKTALHSAITLSIRPSDDTPASLHSKLCLASVSGDGTKYSSAGGAYANGRVSGSVRTFGKYCVVADTIPPKITPSFTDGADLRNAKSVYFTNTDDFSGVASFSATIDGQWIAFDQSSYSRITHYFDPSRIEYTGGRHALVITVRDEKGNATTLKREFVK